MLILERYWFWIDHVVKRFASFVWVGVDNSLKELSSDNFTSTDNDMAKQINWTRWTGDRIIIGCWAVTGAPVTTSPPYQLLSSWVSRYCAGRVVSGAHAFSSPRRSASRAVSPYAIPSVSFAQSGYFPPSSFEFPRSWSHQCSSSSYLPSGRPVWPFRRGTW